MNIQGTLSELRMAREKAARIRELNPYTYTTLMSYRIAFKRIDQIETLLAAQKKLSQSW